MGAAAKKVVKGPKAGAKEAKVAGKGIKGTAKGFVEEAEKTGAALVDEVKELFDNLAHKVAGVAGAAADTTASVAGKVSIKDPAELIRGLLEDVKEAGETSMRMIGKGFDELRDKVISSSEKAPSTKAKAKKKTVKKTSSAKKRVTKKVAKKTTKKAAKKTAKKVVKKKVAKKSSVKKVAARKTAARKKASLSKAKK